MSSGAGLRINGTTIPVCIRAERVAHPNKDSNKKDLLAAQDQAINHIQFYASNGACLTLSEIVTELRKDNFAENLIQAIGSKDNIWSTSKPQKLVDAFITRIMQAIELTGHNDLTSFDPYIAVDLAKTKYEAYMVTEAAYNAYVN